MLEWIDDEDCQRAQPVHLVDRSKGGIGVRAAAPVEKGWPVLLTPPRDAPIKAVVRHRRRDPSGWFLGLQVIQQERRRFDRRPLDSKIDLSWDKDGRLHKAVGRVRDVGEGGLRFVCQADIPRRAVVMLAIDGWQRYATVVHTELERDVRVYGVQFFGPPLMAQGPDFDE
jgi:hypothetical protein